MDKILIVEPLAPKGHKDISEAYLRILRNNYEITYASCIDYPSQKVLEGIDVIKIPKILFQYSNRIKNRINYFKILILILKKVKNQKYDNIIFLSYETISFVMFSLLFKRLLLKVSNNIFILNHTNIDEVLRSKIKRFLYLLLPMEVVNICYEEFITEIVINKFHKKAVTLRHNINEYKKSGTKGFDNFELENFFDRNNTIISAISGNELSMDIIDKLIYLDKKGFLSNNKVKIFLKTNIIKYCSANIFIYNDYLSDNDFGTTLERTDFVFLPYRLDDFDVRISGMFFDALTFEKPLICSNTRFFNHIFHKFGQLGFLYDDLDTLQNIFLKISECKLKEFEANVKSAKEYYSDSSFKQEFNNIMG